MRQTTTGRKAPDLKHPALNESEHTLELIAAAHDAVEEAERIRDLAVEARNKLIRESVTAKLVSAKAVEVRTGLFYTTVHRILKGTKRSTRA